MKFKKFGDWDIVLRVSRNLSQDIHTANKIALSKLAARAEALAVKYVRDQSLNWKPLSKKYLDYKARKGLSTKILIATSTYFQSITSRADAHLAWAGVLRQTRTKDGKESISNVAMIMEYGSIKRNIPPRRLWKVVFNDMITFMKKEKLFTQEALTQIQKRAGR